MMRHSSKNPIQKATTGVRTFQSARELNERAVSLRANGVRTFQSARVALTGGQESPPSVKGFALIVLFSFSVQADTAMRQFLWEQANTQAAMATKPEDFAAAAATYERLVADGVVTADLFVNLGGVYVLAGETAKAQAAFERAERYRGSSPETRQGLLAVMSRQTGRAQVDLPWYRTAFFWHFSMPCNARVLVALSGWALFWGGVFCKLLQRKRKRHNALQSLAETAMLIGGLMALVFAVSAGITIAQEFWK